jgi:hypothetical protein
MSELRRILKVIAGKKINATTEALRSVGYCRPTMQGCAMQLMGSKLEASLGIEGSFSDEGPLAMTQGEDMTMALAKAMAKAMAKALVEGLETEGVESV